LFFEGEDDQPNAPTVSAGAVSHQTGGVATVTSYNVAPKCTVAGFVMHTDANDLAVVVTDTGKVGVPALSSAVIDNQAGGLVAVAGKDEAAALFIKSVSP